VILSAAWLLLVGASALASAIRSRVFLAMAGTPLEFDLDVRANGATSLASNL
jgi:hypothetical protein